MNSGKLQMKVSEEEVKERLSVARRFLESIDPDKLGKCPDTICLNCGRSVLVGKCCDNPNIVVMEKEQVSPETWDQIQEIIKNPPAPTKKLRELMTRKMKYEQI
ncbi:hypothetical protein [Klebsiella phage phiKp_4]|jgi:hypothetical protein|nr:hypothetical protein KNT56_gp240 [Escherichia phage phT4A]QYC51228.1 DUF1778 domain-containing protein [Klebsiella phage vB_KpnM-VAC66]UUG67004.1 hypothetical protein 2DI_00122 [Klebsiella phage PSKm2DI]UYL05592.1 hypothetical protein PMMJPKLI_00052 [Klebsiella phage KP13MC5-1]UZO33383.1 hypothetical protein KEKKGBKC_00113 [Klebsiella phage pR7_1]WKC55042.1 hypothetical protein R61_151 [Klebsiella phage R6_1]WNA08947.1 hypothetical protein [Klebsiella phage P52_1]CAD5240975.1 hypothetical